MSGRLYGGRGRRTSAFSSATVARSSSMAASSVVAAPRCAASSLSASTSSGPPNHSQPWPRRSTNLSALRGMRQRRSRSCTPPGVPALQPPRGTKAREQGLGYSRVEQPNARQRRRRGRSRSASRSCSAHVAAGSVSTPRSSSNSSGARRYVCSRHVGSLAAALSPRGGVPADERWWRGAEEKRAGPRGRRGRLKGTPAPRSAARAGCARVSRALALAPRAASPEIAAMEAQASLDAQVRRAHPAARVLRGRGCSCGPSAACPKADSAQPPNPAARNQPRVARLR